MTSVPDVSDRLESVLNDPVTSTLRGRLRAFGATRGGAVRFDPEVSPFGALPLDRDGHGSAGDWADLAALCGPGGEVVVVRAADGPPRVPAGWELLRAIPGVQMDGSAVPGAPTDDVVELGPADRAEMAELTARTRPGPWLARTAELGRYLGVRHDGRLVAMAGERMRLGGEGAAGATEISAVCTDPQYRGRGLARRLVDAVAAGVVARGERPVLHTAADNHGAIRLYEAMGFTLARAMRFDLLRVPHR
ncbi:GNAT family N-acetyltransferase [Pseudonocardia sp. EV170527-09]|uniref:GNAT family N-acetyltransferase n=1 Tax=Pseudonocardia sp. EV170527-09 TaxID=2603411 RepID=UPI0011F25C64|nr:GNAT family N-acetyltransferase [Pseudonocardia sp. EV170527-09]KAA1031806.1 GNAT family N-acetyltransferase [Pseudonocardia sp. EV170527-09]